MKIFGAEAAGVPAVIVMHGPYLIPRPGIRRSAAA